MSAAQRTHSDTEEITMLFKKTLFAATAAVLATLAARGFAGHVVLELNTRSIGSRSAREEALARALAWSREALTVPVVR